VLVNLDVLPRVLFLYIFILLLCLLNVNIFFYKINCEIHFFNFQARVYCISSIHNVKMLTKSCKKKILFTYFFYFYATQINHMLYGNVFQYLMHNLKDFAFFLLYLIAFTNAIVIIMLIDI